MNSFTIVNILLIVILTNISKNKQKVDLLFFIALAFTMFGNLPLPNNILNITISAFNVLYALVINYKIIKEYK